jgi:hypothetical protein
MAETSGESVQFSNISATTAAFTLKGGNYAMTNHASAYTTLQLQVLAGDGATFVNVGSNVPSDGVTAYANLPPGSYKLNVSATALYVNLTRVPT